LRKKLDLKGWELGIYKYGRHAVILNKISGGGIFKSSKKDDQLLTVLQK